MKIHLLHTRRQTQCGEDGEATAEINDVTCPNCIAQHASLTSNEPGITGMGWDVRWVLAINQVLKDREYDFEILDLENWMWEIFIDPLIDRIVDGANDTPELSPKLEREALRDRLDQLEREEAP